MGYYDYQHGLIYRHLNQEGRWDKHLENCRSFIMKALEIHKPGKVTVLGSGWLLELPLKEMIDLTEEVVLVDIIHPPEVISQAGSLKKVTLSEEDITGGLIEEVWNKRIKNPFFKRTRSLDNITVPEYEPENDPGMVISLNILTQLESLPVDFIKKRSKVEEEELTLFRHKIQKKHIEFLKNHDSVLITDTNELFKDKSGKVTDIKTVMTELPESRYSEKWSWDFDLKGSDYHNKKSVLEVIAILL